MGLDDMQCNKCGKFGCSSFSYTEGSRCHDHSGYVGPRADEANRLGNVIAAKKYKELLETGGLPNETIRLWIQEFVHRNLHG